MKLQALHLHRVMSWFLCILLVGLGAACGSNNPLSPDEPGGDGKNLYFPIAVGNWWKYDYQMHEQHYLSRDEDKHYIRTYKLVSERTVKEPTKWGSKPGDRIYSVKIDDTDLEGNLVNTQTANLLGIRPDGTVRWRAQILIPAELPRPNDPKYVAWESAMWFLETVKPVQSMGTSFTKSTLGGETFQNCLGVGFTAPNRWYWEKDYYAPGVGLIECEGVQIEPRRIINRLKLIEYHVKE